ncbi:MAG: MATE family efflux transporter, partial [Christensenellales bacterium]
MQFLNVSRILKNVAQQGELPSVKELVKRTFAIAWPSTLESFLISLVSFEDIVMVSSLVTSANASVGLTTKP